VNVGVVLADLRFRAAKVTVNFFQHRAKLFFAQFELSCRDIYFSNREAAI
jgi:hypothetical protein